MSKKVQKVNPYEKKKKRTLKISRKQWTALISLLCVIALLVSIIVMTKSCAPDPHEDHDHSDSSGEHYESDGHNHGNSGHAATNPTGSANDKVKYQMYTNADKTHRLVFRDTAGKTLAEFDKIAILADRKETVKAIDAEKGVYELGWPTGSGANAFECVYYNVKTGQVSQKFIAPRGTDGVRIAYGSEDQTKVIVQDLFDKSVYYKEHALENAYTEAENVILSGNLKADKKTVVISYVINDKGEEGHATVKLYE